MTLPEAAIEAAKAAYLKRLNEPEEGGFGELVEAAILAALPHLGKPVAFVHASAIDEFQANSALESFEGVQTVLWTYGGKVRGKQRIPIFLAPPAPAPPEGWRAVPVEPTPEMIAAAYGNYLRGTERGNWKAMLAAAPEPPLATGTASISSSTPVDESMPAAVVEQMAEALKSIVDGPRIECIPDNKIQDMVSSAIAAYESAKEGRDASSYA